MYGYIQTKVAYKPQYLIEYERTLTIAREMKNDGLTSERIAKITGLTEEEIENL